MSQYVTVLVKGLYYITAEINNKKKKLALSLQCIVFEERNEPFLLENALNLAHRFLYDNFNK